jgi:NAD(P)-dependent dehydrogenase (short-subunit alcohol dehydrogenase family)
MLTSANAPRRTLLLTGASRGIGHATVIRFSSAGWRVLTCSRHPFPEDCPWDAGPEDHIQVDLADHADTTRAISEIRQRLEGGALHALVNNAAISPKGAGGSRMGTMDTDIDTWSHVFRVNFFAPIMMPRRRPRQFDCARRDRYLDPVAGHREDRRPANPDAPSRHAGRGGKEHLCAVYRNQFVRELRRDPHQRRSARLALIAARKTHSA